MSSETTEPKENKLKRYFHNLLDIRGANMWILMLAILIASIGLNVSSTAVIIGAMLISPLMGGIMTMGYSLAVRDDAAAAGADPVCRAGCHQPDRLNSVFFPDAVNGADRRTDCPFRRHRRHDRQYPEK